MKKSKIKVKKSGYIFMVVSILLGVGAVNTGNNLLYIVVSGMLSFMLVSGMIARYNLRGVKVSIVPPEDIYAGREAKFKIIVRNEKRFPSLLIRVRIEGAKEDALILTLKERKEIDYPFKFTKRGRVDFINLYLISDFPVGMFERIKIVTVRCDFIVFPEPKKWFYMSGMAEGKEHSELAEYMSKRGRDDIRALKEYEGEPVRFIHWKATAKRGELVVKEMEEKIKKPFVVDLNHIEGTLEDKVSKATYLIDKLMKEGYAVGLKAGNTYIKPSSGNSHRRKMLAFLALL